MYGRLNLSPHAHSGRLRPHEHTSYLPLALLLLVVGSLLAWFSVSASAASPPPQAGSIGLTGSVPTTPPKVAATITSPSNGQHFSTSPITVSGTCPSGTLVEIFKNSIFAGSTPCTSNGTYSLQVDLLFGKNSLTAQVFDVLNQAGPLSAAVTVFYDAGVPQAAPSTFLNLTGAQLLLETDAVYRGTFPGQSLNVPIDVIGGTPPFAINVEWGDSNNQVVPRKANGTFNAMHVYKRAGTYQITLQGTDSRQLVAYLTVAAIVNGQPAVTGTPVSLTKSSGNKVLALWPLYAIAATALASFWIGERREKRLLGTEKIQSPTFGGTTTATPPPTAGPPPPA